MTAKKQKDFLIKYTEVVEDSNGALAEPTKLSRESGAFIDKSEQEKLKEEFTPHTPRTPQI